MKVEKKREHHFVQEVKHQQSKNLKFILQLMLTVMPFKFVKERLKGWTVRNIVQERIVNFFFKIFFYPKVYVIFVSKYR